MNRMLEKMYEEVTAKHAADFPGNGEVHLARAPGRVNVIGEHTDYNGLPVLPTAIDREIAIAFSPSDSEEVSLTNLDTRFGSRTFSLSAEIAPFAGGDWGNYTKAAAQALWGWAEKNAPSSLPLKGFKGCVGGTIPPGSGLSSSSAMVVASAFALISINDLKIERADLASLLAKGERYVGTEGGGMDQAASILSKPESVLKISFNPLHATPISLPDGCAFIIANSMIQASKAGGARLAYNTRVVECRLGLQMLKKLSAESHPEIESASLLGDVMQIIPDWRSLLNQLPEGGLSLSQVAEFCAVDKDDLRARCLRCRDGSFLDEPSTGFQIRLRCKHVLTEGARVDLAASAMTEGRLDDLGQLMNESHESCSRDYEVSCTELDELVATLCRHGALGARLTGAGFGGCAVAAVRIEDAEKVLNGVIRDYYQSYLPSRGIEVTADISSLAFECVPTAGAGIR